MDSLFLLTQNSGKILGPIAKVLGYLMNAIYAFMDKFLHIQNVGLTIILFTIVIYLCLLPLTYKQQKFSKMSQIMNPEIQAIQKKYKNRRDQASVQAMNEETQAVYQKYGVSPSGSCVFMLIQLPILFALYRVIYNVPAYITNVKSTFDGVVTGIMGTSGYQDTMNSFLETVSKKKLRIPWYFSEFFQERLSRLMILSLTYCTNVPAITGHYSRINFQRSVRCYCKYPVCSRAF